jgi:ABC-type sugar transport system substrate-binding protein
MVEKGAQAAAAGLGDRLDITEASDAATQISTIKSLIAEHADAIAIDTDLGSQTVNQVVPELAKARAAGIPTLSFEQQYPGSVWVSLSSPDQFAQALADALASQMGGTGQYAIVPCRPAESIVQTWLKSVEGYVPQRYPAMKQVAVVYGDSGNGNADTHMFKRLIKRHRHLRGLIFLCPGEAQGVPQQVIAARKVGKVFSAGNGGACPPVAGPALGYVRRGAEELVCGGDPVKLGYLVVWAADYLASGHALAPGQYNVGGPVGSVSYYAENQELRLGQPLTITKDNVDQYSGTSR